MPAGQPNEHAHQLVNELAVAGPLEARLARLDEQSKETLRAVSGLLVDRALSQLRVNPGEAGNLAAIAIAAHARAGEGVDARATCVLAQTFLLRGQFQAALDCVSDIEDVPTDRALPWGAEDVRVQALIHLERHAEAEAAAEALLAAATKDGDTRRVLWVRMNLADLAFRRDAPRQALAHYWEVDRLLPDNAPNTIRAALASNRANSLEALNRFHAAERQFERAQALFTEAGCDHTAAQVEYNAAYAASLRGRYAEALRRYANVEQTFEQQGDERHLAHIDLDRAEIHLQMHMHADAAEMATRAERRFIDLDLKKEQSQAAFLAGRAAELAGNTDEAVFAYDRAQSGFAAQGLRGRQIGCLAQRARIALKENDPSQARRLLQEAEDLTTADDASTAVLSYLRARLALQGDQPELALQLVEESLDRFRRTERPWMRLEGEWIRGRALTRLDRLDDAIAAYHKAIESLERYRVGVPPDEYMTAFLAGHSALYEEIVALLVRRGDSAEAFSFAERAKSRALIDLLAARRRDDRGVPAGEGEARLQHLRERLRAIYRRLNRDDGTSASRSARSLRQVRAEAERVESEAARIARDGRLRDREIASLEAVSVPDLQKVQADLGTDRTLVEYFLTSEALYTFVVTATDQHVVRREVDVEHIRFLVQRFQFHLSQCERAGGKVKTADLQLRAVRSNLSALAEILVGDIADALQTKHLVVIPHGLLHHVPFHALPHGDGWFCEAHTVTYAPSAAVYGYCRRTETQSSPEASILGLPDAVAPEIAREATALANKLQGARLFLGERATFETLRSEAARARVLHIASHGMFRHGQPMMSAIRLADRWVNLYDLYDLQVAAELVVLSTCESGVADVTDGNEILGLTRGFLYAGAPALLTSQWRVNDSATADFMDAFYSQLLETTDVAQALQHAMAVVRATRPHPYHWAPFFLVGRPRNVAICERRTSGALVIETESLQPEAVAS